MLDELMSEETLQKVTVNATALCLRFNHGKKEIPPEYNQQTILQAYEVLEKKISKDILFNGLNAFMDVSIVAPGKQAQDGDQFLGISRIGQC